MKTLALEPLLSRPRPGLFHVTPNEGAIGTSPRRLLSELKRGEQLVVMALSGRPLRPRVCRSFANAISQLQRERPGQTYQLGSAPTRQLIVSRTA